MFLCQEIPGWIDKSRTCIQYVEFFFEIRESLLNNRRDEQHRTILYRDYLNIVD
jgi:hypothetical protein